MKKIILFVITVIIMASCTSEPEYLVTVIGKSTNTVSKLRGDILGAGSIYYSAVTKSNDTLDVIVPETVAYRNAPPYKAVMKKGTGTRIGTIDHAIGVGR
jgi:hypothetical protein